MLAAEFGYTRVYALEHMTITRFLGHMRYRQDHPHPGAMIMAILKSFSGEEKKIPKKGKLERTKPVEPEEKPWKQKTDAEKKQAIMDFAAAFGMPIERRKKSGDGEGNGKQPS